MNKMNTLAFVNSLLIKLFPTLIRQKFPSSKICTIQYVLYIIQVKGFSWPYLISKDLVAYNIAASD